MEQLQFFILGIMVGVILLAIIKSKENGIIHFNSPFTSIKSKYFVPTFEVTLIEKAEDSEGKPIAKYHVVNTFFDKEDNKNFMYQRFYFYDSIGKYELGQSLTFNQIKYYEG